MTYYLTLFWLSINMAIFAFWVPWRPFMLRALFDIIAIVAFIGTVWLFAAILTGAA